MENHEKNLILYGPPGTGKTYSVIDEALKIIDSAKYANIIGKPEKRTEAQAAFRGLCDNMRIRFCKVVRCSSTAALFSCITSWIK